jgi:hypothetical protein
MVMAFMEKMFMDKWGKIKNGYRINFNMALSIF